MKGIEVDFSGVENVLKECDMNDLSNKVKYVHEMLEKKQGLGREMTGWLDLPETMNEEELFRIKETAKKIRTQAEILVVIGIGGSYLGSKAVIDMFKTTLPLKKGPEVVYVGNNLSSTYIRNIIEYVQEKEICVNVISKSGTTIEPAIAFRMFKLLLEDKYGIGGANERIYVTTDEESGALRQMANDEGYTSFVIPKNVGGRYSVLSSCGLLPIAVAGIDIEELLDGALFARQMYNTSKIEANDSYKYALVRNLLYHTQGKDIEVLASYEPFMKSFEDWFCQLFGESEGKNAGGIFPVGLVYTTDLHSMGQLMQQGKRNVFETVINIEKSEEVLKVPSIKDMPDCLEYIENISLDYINKMAMEGTKVAHIDGQVPYIGINLDKLNEYNVGQLIFFFEKACAMSGYLMGVNPFDQPGVEAYKQNMRKLLEQGNN